MTMTNTIALKDIDWNDNVNHIVVDYRSKLTIEKFVNHVMVDCKTKFRIERFVDYGERRVRNGIEYVVLFNDYTDGDGWERQIDDEGITVVNIVYN